MTVRTAIYARSSLDCPLTADQQIECLETVAAKRGWTIVQVYSDRPTTVRKGVDRRPGETALLDAIRSDVVDRIAFWSVDRVGRSLVELVGLLETCRCAGTAVWIEEQQIDTASSVGMSLFDFSRMMGLHLRQGRRDRILRGQAAARSQSIRFGRPPLQVAKVEKAKQGLAGGKGVREVARLAGISAASASRLKNALTSTMGV
jgi:DNA invertase Pin-like site-specific DNA recombinase